MECLLRKENIQVMFRENKKGQVYGITYFDQFKKSVFNGSDLGKEYAANAISQRLVAKDQLQQPERMLGAKQQIAPAQYSQILQTNHEEYTPSLIAELLQGRRLDDYIPGQLVKKRTRKRKQAQHQRKI
jgi:hypothetical protein